MKDRFIHFHDDHGRIGEWLADRTVQVTPSAPIIVPPTPPEPPEPPEAIVAARKKPIPRPRADACGHCGAALPAVRSAAKVFCSRRCSIASRKAG
jgi:hypothetical protein